MTAPKKNAGKAPAVQFYYKDFLADMQEHPPEIVGAWMLVLIKIWHVKNNGEITRTITQFASVMNTTEKKAQEYLDYFKAEDIGNVSNDNGKITVLNRRTQRDAKLLEQNRLRQETYRKKHSGNGDGSGDVTGGKRNPSSSTSTSTPIPDNRIGIEESSLENEGLGLKQEIKIKAFRFIEGLEQKFHRISKDEATTFSRIAQYLSGQMLLGVMSVDIFDEALGWAEVATTSGAKNPKGLWVAKVKEQTGFTGRGKLLDGGPNGRA